MIDKIFIKFNNSEIEFITEKLLEYSKILKVKYAYRTALLMIFLEILLIFLVYIAETNNYKILLFISVMLTIVPVWIIITSLVFFYIKRIPIKKKYRSYKRHKTTNGYEALVIKSNKCEKYFESNIDYYMFYISYKNVLFLRAQDFETSEILFPNSNFIIPPVDLFEIIGNKITEKGDAIINIIHDSELIKKNIELYNFIEIGNIKYFEDFNV